MRGKVNIFEVSFDNPQAVYSGGQLVSGHVTVEATKPIKMRGIRLKFSGKADVYWSEGSGDSKRTYHSSEKYLSSSVVIFGRDSHQKGDDMEMAIGRHTFPYQFHLPDGLPSSFEGRHGYVRYSVKATIDVPWDFDHNTKRCFTVASVLDLNRDMTALIPQENSDDKVLCCLCCASGPISAKLSIPRKGYVPGECITINAKVVNKSSRQMDEISIKLYQEVLFRAEGSDETDWTEVATMSKPNPIRPNSEDKWVNGQLKIPPTPPSFLEGCQIMDIKYILVLEVDPSGPSLDLEVPVDILIGTVPHHLVVAAYHAGGNYDLQHTQYPPPLMPSAASHTAPLSLPMTEPWADSVPPPPSYESCFSGPVDISEEDDNNMTGSLEYTPMYTYYDWTKHTT